MHQRQVAELGAASNPQSEGTACYRRVRDTSLRLAAGLSPEDCALQSMPEASPVKWHLAHTTWFFETFVLERAVPDYRHFHPRFRVLFNSYYNAVGERHPRPQRGLISRPDLQDVVAYRSHVDRHRARRRARTFGRPTATSSGRPRAGSSAACASPAMPRGRTDADHRAIRQRTISAQSVPGLRSGRGEGVSPDCEGRACTRAPGERPKRCTVTGGTGPGGHAALVICCPRSRQNRGYGDSAINCPRPWLSAIWCARRRLSAQFGAGTLRESRVAAGNKHATNWVHIMKSRCRRRVIRRERGVSCTQAYFQGSTA